MVYHVPHVNHNTHHNDHPQQHDPHHHSHGGHHLNSHHNNHNGHHSVYNTGSELSLRDLHRLDYLFNLNEEKSLLVRRHAVLFAMDPVRAVVMSNRLLILAPEDNDPLIDLIDQYMKGTLGWHLSFVYQLNPCRRMGEPLARPRRAVSQD